MRHKGRLKIGPTVGAMFGLLAAGATMQSLSLPFWREHYRPPSADLSNIAADQLLFAVAGFREMIAGILWVRADAYFNEGNYDAILPMIRVVTYLDPKQIDVYATGMWHIAYNFTDSESRADRRNIPIAVAFGKEGAKNNPHTYELFYETGWLWYHRIQDDFPNAVYWFDEAAKREDMLPARKNLLAHARLRNNDADGALKTFYQFYRDAETLYEKDKQRGSFANLQTIEGNLDNLLVRMSQRGFFAQKNGTYESGDYDTKPPYDVKFSVRVSVIEPRVLEVDGTWNVYPVGTRVKCILRDADYPGGREAGLEWDSGDANDFSAPRDRTYMQDELFVRNLQFRRTINMSRDPTIYPFRGDKYYLDFFYTPRIAPEHLKDKYGWNGEGFTDSNFLRTDVREGQRVVFYRMELTRDQLLRRREFAMEGGIIPTFKTDNYVPPTSRSGSSSVLTPAGEPEQTPAPGQ
ncbi:MAG: hypothetical protein KF812_07530 [Fimbriimonadaceae bacterium]|nr:hypothetical protein [Fimbriimonadaceae bacterium]